MYLKITFYVFLIAIVMSLDKCLGDRLLSIGSGTLLQNERIVSIYPHEGDFVSVTSCGGTLTEFPGKIELQFERSKPARNVNCVWKIKGPANHRVYVRELEILHTTPNEATEDVKDNFHDSISIEIYDGDKVSTTNRLFKFGNDKLDKCIGKGKDLTVLLKFNESGLHVDHNISLSYSSAPANELADIN